jgi:predicted small metal-binding protein
MKTLACKDIDPTLNCEFVAKAETDDATVQMMTEHAAVAHPEKMEQMKAMSPEEVKTMMMSHVKEETM